LRGRDLSPRAQAPDADVRPQKRVGSAAGDHGTRDALHGAEELNMNRTQFAVVLGLLSLPLLVGCARRGAADPVGRSTTQYDVP
jgi:hypothetical protein